MEFVLIFAHQQSEGISDCCLPMHTNALHPDNSQVHLLCTTRVAAAWELLATTEAQNNTGALHYPILASRRMQKTELDPGVALQQGHVCLFSREFFFCKHSENSQAGSSYWLLQLPGQQNQR